MVFHATGWLPYVPCLWLGGGMLLIAGTRHVLSFTGWSFFILKKPDGLFSKSQSVTSLTAQVFKGKPFNPQKGKRSQALHAGLLCGTPHRLST